MTRRICIVTGTRAEYGLLKGLIAQIADHPALELSLVVTGAHLSPDHGMTVAEIETDGFPIAARLPILTNEDTPAGVSAAMGAAMTGFGVEFARLQPSIVVLLGDRYEILAAAAAALIATIPVAHIAGGELTEGAIDESIRHAVTKLAHLHFVAAEDYRRRVIQLGEDPARVFTVGGLGGEAATTLDLLDRAALEESLELSLGTRSLLITFHPPTIDPKQAGTQMQAMLDALDRLGEDVALIFTMPNADAGGRALAEQLDAFAADRPNVRVFDSLGQLRYLSAMAQVSGVVGNSSSGLAEAPSFGVGTVNIGDRQDGRLRAQSVIDCAPEADAIHAALQRLFSPEFAAVAQAAENPNAKGDASRTITHVLADYPLEGLVRKRFHDLFPSTDDELER